MSAYARISNPFARSLAEAERDGRKYAYLATRELHYLAGCGALEHLRAAAAVLGVQVALTEPGLVPLTSSSRRGSAVALGFYASAEALALDSLTRVTAEQLAVIAVRLTVDITGCISSRSVLLSRGLPVPGRASWLTQP